MRGHGPVDINHANITKGPASRRNQARGHERPAVAGNAGIRTGRIQPGRIHDKRPAIRAKARPLVEQTNSITVQASCCPRARDNNAPAAAHGQAARKDACHRLAVSIGPVSPGVDCAAES